MENSDVPESSFYVLLTPAANYRQEPEASWHVASRSPSPGIHAPVANHRFSSTPAAKCPPPASSTLGLRMNFKRGRGVLNKENHQTNGGCVFCIRDVLEEPCPLHSHSVPDSEVLPLALATLPSSLSFIRAAADAAPGGVRAECSFSSRTVFGPMRGVMCPHAKLQPPLFGIPDRPTLHGILRFHTESPHGCNWMQFVRLATHTAEHNLTAYNVNGEVYFATKRDIAAGEELTVWYSTNYAKAMRISGRLREISNDPVPLRGRMGVLGRPVAFCDDLVWESGLPDSLPPDESIMQTDAVDLVPPAKEDSIHQEGEGNDSGSGSICIDYETAASDAENETAKAISPTGNVHESKAQYPKRGSLVHQKTIVRLKAVMAVNPYQFPVGTPRIQAFDAVVRQLDGPDLSATELTSRSKALRRLVKDCLDIFPETLQRFDKSSCDERTMEYVSLMKKLRKMVKNSCKEKEVVPRHVNADTVKKLQAVREVNPYQYPLPSAERQAAWESVMRNLLGDLETEELVIQMKKMKRLVRECLISRDDTFRRCARQRDEVTQQYKSVVEELIILAGINKDDEGKESGAEGCSSELEIRAEDAAKLPPALPVDGDGSRDSYTMETGSDLPMALDTADEGCGTDSDASSVEQPKRKRKRRTRFRHDNPEAVKRLEAIVQVNPYQYPPGKDRDAAFNAAVHLLGRETPDTPQALKTFVHRCLETAAEKAQQFNDAAGPVFQRYIELLQVLIAQKQDRIKDVPVVRSRREDPVAQLKAVVDVNPFQYNTVEARSKAFASAVKLYSKKKLSPTKLEKEGRALERRVKSRLDQLPKLLENYDPGNAGDSLKEYMEVLQKIPELKDNGEKIVRPSSRVSRAPALRMKPATEGVHACTACMFSFESAELLALHTRGHDAAAVEEGGATACPGCQEECGSMTALIAHVAEHRKAYRPRQQCPDCGLYVSVKFFDQHIKTLHPEKSDDPAATFTCGECKKEFGAQKQLWAHEQIHRSKSCLFCAQLFPSWRHLSQHVAQHKQSEGFPCLHCAKTCDSYAVLSRHCRAQHDAKAVCICEICGAIKRNHGALRHHMLNHANTFRHPCDLCGKGFKTTTTLRTHQRWKHSTELKEKHKQHKQKQSGVPRDYLNPRQRMRFEEFKFRCEECRFGFLTEGRWLRHKEKFHYEE